MEASTVKKEPVEARALRAKMLMTVLDVDVQELADEIGADRSNLTKIIAGERKGLRLRPKLVKALCGRIEQFILDPEEEPQAKAA